MLRKLCLTFFIFFSVLLVAMRLLPCASFNLIILNDQEIPISLVFTQASGFKLEGSSKLRIDKISLPTQINGVGHFILSIHQNNKKIETLYFGDYNEIDKINGLYLVIKNNSEVDFFKTVKEPKSRFLSFLKLFTQSIGCIGNELFSTYEYRDHPRLEIIG